MTKKITNKEKFRDLCQWYADSVGRVIDYRPEYWVAEEINRDVCCYGDCYFLSLDEMQIIIDHLDKWVHRYGSERKVGYEVVKWMEWCVMDLNDSSVTHRTTPRINLWSWLNGLRPEDIEVCKDDKLEMICFYNDALSLVDALIKEFRGKRTLANVKQNIEAVLKELNAQRAEEANELIKQLERERGEEVFQRER